MRARAREPARLLPRRGRRRGEDPERPARLRRACSRPSGSGGRHPDDRGRPVRRGHRASAAASCTRSSREARRRHVARAVPRGARRQPRRAGALRRRSASARSACRRGYYQPDDVDAIVMRLRCRPRSAAARHPGGMPATPTAGAAHEPRRAARARHRDVAATRPASASCAARTLLANIDRLARWTSTPATAASCPRSRPAPTSRRSSPTIAAALAEAGVALADLDAVAVTSGPGLAGALMVGVGAAKALARRARASRSTPSTTSSATSPPTSSTTSAAARVPRPWRCSCRGGHTSLLLVRDLVVRRRAARRDHGRRGGRGVRQGRAAARPALPRRPRDRPGRASAAIPTAIRFPRGLTPAEGPGGAPLRLHASRG